MKRLSTLLLISLLFLTLQAQRISFDAEGYNHVYEAGGVSIGLYFGHYNSMSDANKDEFIKLMYEDCNTKYIQDYYHDWPSDIPEKLDKVAAYYKRAQVYQPDVEFSAVFNGFTKGTCKSFCTQWVNGEDTTWILDADRPDVYDEMARWYYEMTLALWDRGVKMTVLNLVNEPDFNKKYRYGKPLGNKEGVGRILTNAIPKFREMMADSTLNPKQYPCPDVMAASTLDPSACSNYIDHWKTEHPIGWSNVDIVSTHQYANGTNWDVFQKITKRLDGRRFIQSEQHTNRGGGLGDITEELSKEHTATLSTGVLFFTAINSGVSSWWYFQDNYPQEFHNGGLIRIPWGGAPAPYSTYYAFKQLNSLQPAYSSKLTFGKSGLSKLKLTAFRHQEDNKIYCHMVNMNNSDYPITFDALKGDKDYKITGVRAWATDDVRQVELFKDESFDTAMVETVVNIPKYTVCTVELTLETETSGFSKTEIKNNISLYPNPVIKDMLYIDTNEKITDISVFSLTGKRTACYHEGNKVDVSLLEKGMYIISINGKHCKSFMKQ